MFGRQPEKVTVRLEGDPLDVADWARYFARVAEYKGDMVKRVGNDIIIYPRAVND